MITDKPTPSRATLGGLVATLVMTVMMYTAPMMGMPKMDVAAMPGSMFSGQMQEPMSGLWVFGMLLHFINGSLSFPLIYAYGVLPWLPGSAWLRGLLWG